MRPRNIPLGRGPYWKHLAKKSRGKHYDQWNVLSPAARGGPRNFLTGPDSSDEVARVGIKGYYEWKIFPKMSFFTLRRHVVGGRKMLNPCHDRVLTISCIVRAISSTLRPPPPLSTSLFKMVILPLLYSPSPALFI